MSDASCIFICYSSKDEGVALRVAQTLEAEGLKCWISARDVPPGQNYQETIIGAIEHAKAIVFLFSENSARSGEIKKELSIASSLNMPVYPLRLTPITPSGALRYELATRQWVDMFPDADLALRRLATSLQGGVHTATPLLAAAPTPATAAAENSGGPEPLVQARKRARKRPPVIALDSPEFEAIRVQLARHIGPIAKVLMQKIATEVRTSDEFVERLASHVSTPADRSMFQQAARAQLGLK